jgi:hypothetical protein
MSTNKFFVDFSSWPDDEDDGYDDGFAGRMVVVSELCEGDTTIQLLMVIATNNDHCSE